MTEYHITKHAFERIRKRMGLNKKAARREVRRFERASELPDQWDELAGHACQRR